jgi:glycine/D-amino acid oxidase-like deaminating enzyme
LEAEVVIIGGGITGALLSSILSRSGMNVVLLDKRNPCTGSTAASTGLLQYEVDVPLVDLIAKVGRDRAVHAYRRGMKAIDEIEELSGTLNEKVSFARRKSIYLASDESDIPELQRQFDCLKEFDFPVGYLNHSQLADISSIRAQAAIASQADAQINPLELSLQLLERAVENGALVFGQTRVTSLQNYADYSDVVHTSGRIRAKHVVFATGYEASEHIRITPGKLLSTFALAMTPKEEIAGWPEHALIWEISRPYLYARQTKQGHIIVGGGDTAYADDHRDTSLLREKMMTLMNKFHRWLPEVELTPQCCWGGTFAETPDGLAMIGRIPHYRNYYAALGYGGNGITFSMIAARLIRDVIVGRKNDDEAVFSFERFQERQE